MNRQEIRLRLVESVISRSGNLSPDGILAITKKLEEWVDEPATPAPDKVQAPGDSEKERILQGNQTLKVKPRR